MWPAPAPADWAPTVVRLREGEGSFSFWLQMVPLGDKTIVHSKNFFLSKWNVAKSEFRRAETKATESASNLNQFSAHALSIDDWVETGASNTCWQAGHKTLRHRMNRGVWRCTASRNPLRNLRQSTDDEGCPEVLKAWKSGKRWRHRPGATDYAPVHPLPGRNINLLPEESHLCHLAEI